MAFKVKSESRISDLLPITHLNSPTIFELKNGQVGSTFLIEGLPFDTQNDGTLNRYRRLLHQAVNGLGEEFMVYAHTFRRRLYSLDIKGDFTNDFCREVDDAYNAQFKSKYLYKNEHYLTIVYRGITAGKTGKGVSVFKKLSSSAMKSARDAYRIKAVGRLKKGTKEFKSKVARFRPTLLGERDASRNCSELLIFFADIVNGLDSVNFKYSEFASPIVEGVSGADKELKRYPNGNVSHYLPAKRLLMGGDHIEFHGVGKQVKYAGILSVKVYGTDTFSGMLNSHMALDCEYVQTNTFMPENRELSIDLINKQLIKMENANDDAVSQMQSLQECKDHISSNTMKMGYHHYTIMLLAPTLESLKENIDAANRNFADIGVVAVEESLSLNLKAAFIGQFPGNEKHIARSALITSHNFIDHTPFHTYRTGYKNRNHLGAAATILQTPSNSPIFFNWHKRGSGKRNDLTPGHGSIIGGNGSGKTVLMAFIDAQMDRYQGCSYFFDRDRGLEIYIRACGGSYLIISPDYESEVNLNPFQLADLPSNRNFLKKWLAGLILEEGESELPVRLANQLAKCIEYNYTLVQHERTLRNVIKILPSDFERLEHFTPWLKDAYGDNHGAQSYLFDHDEDHLSLDTHKFGFDFTHLMDNENHNVMNAVCMYIMHRIEATMKLAGHLISIYFDEGWQILNNPYWEQKLPKALATYRKCNAHIVLATQAPESVVESKISKDFKTNSATTIFFCNESADPAVYEHFDIQPAEFEFLKETPNERRLFLYKQRTESAIVKLDLSGQDELLNIFSGNLGTVKLLENIRANYGDDPRVWRPIFNDEVRVLNEEMENQNEN